MFQSILCGSLCFKPRLDHSTAYISLPAITNRSEMGCQNQMHLLLHNLSIFFSKKNADRNFFREHLFGCTKPIKKLLVMPSGYFSRLC